MRIGRKVEEEAEVVDYNLTLKHHTVEHKKRPLSAGHNQQSYDMEEQDEAYFSDNAEFMTDRKTIVADRTVVDV